jgi:hypothetical protein
MVPRNSVEGYDRFSSYSRTLFTDWETFSQNVSEGKVEFYQITKYLENKNTSSFEDNIDFYSSRYAVGTKYLSNQIVSNFINSKEFSIDWFLCDDYKMRYRYLKRYCTEIYPYLYSETIDNNPSLLETLESISEDRAYRLLNGG